MLLVVVLVLFCYFGGKYCPSVLKKNKELLLGLAGGLILCSFFGMRLVVEGNGGTGAYYTGKKAQDQPVTNPMEWTAARGV